MEIDITDFVKNENSRDYQDSIMGSGLDNIGKITWNNAKNTKYCFVTEENKDTLLQYFLAFGAWEREEINTIIELNALFIQCVSGEMQNYDFEKKNNIAENERSSSIFESDDRYYFDFN